MESQQNKSVDRKYNNLSEDNSALQKLRHIPRRTTGSSVGFAPSCSQNSLSASSSTTATTTVATFATKTTVIDDSSATHSVVTSMTMSRRRQSVQCPDQLKKQSFVSASRRSRSHSTTCATVSSSAIHNTFMQCSTTELRSHRTTSVRRATRTATDPLAPDVAGNTIIPESSKRSGSRDLEVNIVLGYNHTIRGKVTNVKSPNLLGKQKSMDK